MVRWSDGLLAMAAVLVSWLPCRTLLDRFASAREILVEVFSHRRRPGRSSQGFFEALASRGGRLLQRFLQAYRPAVERIANALGCWLREGFAAFAVDGSRVECPRTQANQEALKCAGREKTGPQLQLTALRHLGSGLLWDWRVGPGVEAERSQLREMIDALPAGALLVADAGFTGYDLFRAILDGGRHLLIRVGSNVRLIEGLTPDEKDPTVVHLWPTEKRQKHLPAIRLRLITICDGQQTIYLVTDLPAERLSEEQTHVFYEQRWGMEVGFRTLKQTMGHRTMLSRSPERAAMELHWAVVGQALLEAMAVEAQGNPDHVSPAEAQRVVRTAMRKGRQRCRSGWLQNALAHATRDNYIRRRPKTSRDYPRKKTQKPPGHPKRRPASFEEVQAHKTLTTPPGPNHFAA